MSAPRGALQAAARARALLPPTEEEIGYAPRVYLVGRRPRTGLCRGGVTSVRVVKLAATETATYGLDSECVRAARRAEMVRCSHV